MERSSRQVVLMVILATASLSASTPITILRPVSPISGARQRSADPQTALRIDERARRLGVDEPAPIAGGLRQQFLAPITYPVVPVFGLLLHDLVTGDFNGDGRPDFAAAFNPGSGPQSLFIFLNQGSLKFTQTTLPLPYQKVSGIAVADVNGDGHPDLLVVNSASKGTVGVLLGRGDGTFQPLARYAAGNSPFGIAVGDFNGDGFPDVLVNNGSGSFTVLLGKGDGTFSTQPTFTTTTAATEFAAGDLNGDGKLDLVVNGPGTMISVLPGKGDGTFGSPVSFPSGPAPGQIVFGDFNGDGKEDVAVFDFGSVNNGTAVDVFLGKGDGTFQPVVHYSLNEGQTFGALSAADLDASGRTDLIDAGGDGLSVLYGRGDGTFKPVVHYSFAGNNSLAIADVAGKARLDVVIAGGSSALAIILNPGNERLDAAQSYALRDVYVGSIAEGDFNGDGKVDVAVAATPSDDTNSDGQVTVFLGNGDGTFPLAGLASFDSGGQGPATILSADLNHDGFADLVVANAGTSGPGNVAVFLGNGDGTFRADGSYAQGSGGSMVLGDFNGDGFIDIAVSAGNQAPSLSILLGNGDGTFRSGATVSLPFQGYDFHAADVNFDGKLDFVLPVAGQGGAFYVLLGNGDGTFQTAITTTLPSGYSAITVGDFNHDGKPDVGFAQEPTSCGSALQTVGVLLGKGDGTFQPPILRQPALMSCGFGIPAAADFNGDGNLDLAASSGESLLLFLGDGTGHFGPPQYTLVSTGPMVVGDLNGDGVPDVVMNSGVGFTVLLSAQR